MGSMEEVPAVEMTQNTSWLPLIGFDFTPQRESLPMPPGGMMEYWELKTDDGLILNSDP